MRLSRSLRAGNAADRLLNAGGVAYTWDDLGRLCTTKPWLQRWCTVLLATGLLSAS